MKATYAVAMAVVALAGCNGPDYKPPPADARAQADLRAQKAAAEEAALSAYGRVYGNAAADTCLRAFRAELANAQVRSAGRVFDLRSVRPGNDVPEYHQDVAGALRPALEATEPGVGGGESSNPGSGPVGDFRTVKPTEDITLYREELGAFMCDCARGQSAAECPDF